MESEPTLSLPVHLAKKDQVNRRAKEQLAGWEKMVGDARTSKGYMSYMLVVMVFMLLFNVSSLPLMFYVVEVLGLFSC